MEGVHVYVPDADHVWLPGVITQSAGNGKELVVRLEQVVGPQDAAALSESPEADLLACAGAERRLNLTDPATSKALASRHASVSNSGPGGAEEEAAPSLPLQNATSAHPKGFEDMITIDHLHEASILHNLRRRFFHKLPYTYTGKICIAVNPYQWLDLYDKSVMTRFSDGSREHKPPHVYAVSMEAFFSMRDQRSNQSILVSGESGAGKTETTKIVMSHLAALAEHSNSKVIQQIIQANPLLESFGNAKTVRNDNSSRFGKFTELQFSGGDSRLVGAYSRTYLLEKSRVTTQAPGERNFHIFYQLLQQRDRFPDLALDSHVSFTYVSGSGPEAKSGAADEEGNLTHTCEALELVGIGGGLQQEIFQILAAVLHLGETRFATRDGDVDVSRVVDMSPFETACRLLGVAVEALERAVCNRNVRVGREVFLKPMTPDQAADCRDALAKSLYSKLFLWLVEQINDTIGVKPSVSSGTSGSTAAAASFIGILDIFGFEHFETNSFEQFCINYANEKLQQKFVQDVLKTVQIEYEEENISWAHIQFADNQDVLDLIEGRLGVISFLNEESLLATGTDTAFASKLGAVMESNPLLEIPRLNKCAFTVYHYAGKVTYDASGFLDKHRDAILPDIKQCMSTSTLQILSKTFQPEAADAPERPARGKVSNSRKPRAQAQPKRSTVGSQFKESLSQLMDKINLTEVHYVRCLKPNGLKSAHAFSHHEIVNQLRCAGVIEAIRVSRSAYPSRIPHYECVKKFGLLLGASGSGGDGSSTTALTLPPRGYNDSDPELMRTECESLMKGLLPDGHLRDYQVGLTRVYFREGVLEMLETRRGQALRKYAITIQKNARGLVARQRFVRQRVAACRIQSYWRRHVARHRFVTLRRGVIRVQAQVRGRAARRAFRTMKLAYYVVRFQAICRAFLMQRRYQTQRQAARRIQSFWRFTLLRLVFLRKMEKEKKYKALGSKVARLQMRLDQKHELKTSPSATSGKSRGSAASTGSASGLGSGSGNGNGVGSGSFSAASGRNSMLVNPRMSSVSATGILDESQEVITALHEENERLRQQLEQEEDEIQKLKVEIRNLRNWQKTKEVDDKVQKLAHRDQESKDLTYLYALETEYEKLRTFVCDNMSLPPETGSLSVAAAAAVGANGSSPHIGGAAGSSAAVKGLPSLSPTPTLERSTSTSTTVMNAAETAAAAARSGVPEHKVSEANHLLLKSAARLASAKSKITTKGSARRVKDQWEEIRNYPPPMQYTLGSVPWKRLLTDWAQGNPKKLDYMTRWLKNVLDGGPIVSDAFPMGVELKYVTPMMLDGFMQLVIPKLAERPDIQVHVHTKEFIGTSMRITLSPLDNGKSLGSSGYASTHGASGRVSTSHSSVSRSHAPPAPNGDHESYRVSILANQTPMASGGGGRLSMASTVSSESSSHRPSGGFFRSSRGGRDRDEPNMRESISRGSFFRK